MRASLRPEGGVLAAFGPTWYRLLRGQLVSVFPWAHLVLSERALIRWWSGFKADDATLLPYPTGTPAAATYRR